jgi:hypothetical protein
MTIDLFIPLCTTHYLIGLVRYLNRVEEDNLLYDLLRIYDISNDILYRVSRLWHNQVYADSSISKFTFAVLITGFF